MTMQLVYSIRDAARLANVPEKALRRWVDGGEIKAVKSGNRYYVSWASVVRFLGDDTTENGVM